MEGDDGVGGEPEPTSHSFMSQRLRLNYLDWGNPDAPTLILVHGGRDHARSWDWTARALRRDWHVLAPDLRGHGDSAWSPDGAYLMPYFTYDLAQLIHQQGERPVTLVGHSLGGGIVLRHAALYPEQVRRVVAIEGLGPSPARLAEQAEVPPRRRWRDWIEARRGVSGRFPRRYPTIEEALARMRQENGFLSEEQARHLTIHGVNRNEDGSYSWKYDNYLFVTTQPDWNQADLEELWGLIECPLLLIYGRDSWASNPAEDGRAAFFRSARIELFDRAGHWVHHDRFDAFVEMVRTFIAE